jgi:hypothetical protein
VSKSIDRMEAAQLVRRRTPSEDRRRAIGHLTERGPQLATPLVLRIRRHDASIARLLGKPPPEGSECGLTRLIDLVEQVPRWAMVRERRRRKRSVTGGHQAGVTFLENAENSGSGSDITSTDTIGCPKTPASSLQNDDTSPDEAMMG